MKPFVISTCETRVGKKARVHGLRTQEGPALFAIRDLRSIRTAQCDRPCFPTVRRWSDIRHGRCISGRWVRQFSDGLPRRRLRREVSHRSFRSILQYARHRFRNSEHTTRLVRARDGSDSINDGGGRSNCGIARPVGPAACHRCCDIRGIEDRIRRCASTGAGRSSRLKSARHRASRSPSRCSGVPGAFYQDGSGHRVRR